MASSLHSSLAGPVATVSVWDSRSGGGWNEDLLLSVARSDLAAASAGSVIAFAGGLCVHTQHIARNAHIHLYARNTYTRTHPTSLMLGWR